MSDSLYIITKDVNSGKSVVSLGLMDLLQRNICRVGFFRPLIDDEFNSRDHDIELISKWCNIDLGHDEMYGIGMKKAKELFSKGKTDEITESILKKYKNLEDHYDFILCEGTDYTGSANTFEFNFNANTAMNLGCPVLLVTSGYRQSVDNVVQSTEMAVLSLQNEGCDITAVIVNRIDPDKAEEIVNILKSGKYLEGISVYTIPEYAYLNMPIVGDVADMLKADIISGNERLSHKIKHIMIADMRVENFLKQLKDDSLIITAGDRVDILLVSLITDLSSLSKNISGILLTGGVKPANDILTLINSSGRQIPILGANEETASVYKHFTGLIARIMSYDTKKITKAISIFEKNVDLSDLEQKVITKETTIVTPKMFEFEIIHKAKKYLQHIVLPEGEDDRILKAAEILLQRKVVQITLLGNKDRILNKAGEMELELEDANIVDPWKSNFLDEYIRTYYDLRKHKGISEEFARDIMTDVSYFGTMMLYKGDADGMVSGAVHTTGDTIRPAFEFIKTKENVSIISSVFFMCLQDRVLVYGDCAVNPKPDSQQLAEIALSSAQTAMNFSIAPKVAMLSYSTGESGKGEEVERVREAAEIAREKAGKIFPDLKIEGPIQYDAAVDPDVAKTKMPESEVAGRATVFIFPDLNTGNNTYKAVQRSAGAVAIGPILQGLNAPVNDLSRGCTVPDIVNTVAITAIQAQAERGFIHDEVKRRNDPNVCLTPFNK